MEVIVGKNPVKETLLFTRRIKKVFLAEDKKKVLQEIASLATSKKIKVKWMKKEDFYRKFPFSAAQGVAALVESFPYKSLHELIKSLSKSSEAVVVVLDGVEDPQNFGSLLRTVECLEGNGVVIRKKRSVKVTTTVHKVSGGAAERVPIAMVNNVCNALEELKKEGFWVFGAEARAEKSIFEVKLEGKVVLVLGSEGQGLSRLVREKCDELFSIPVKGKIGSLNVAVTGAILLYEILRRKNESLSIC